MIQALIRLYYKRWAAWGRISVPGLRDALDFMVSEVGEVMDAVLRVENKDFIRNHPTEGPISYDDVAEELFDVIMMGCVALTILGYDLLDVGTAKLRRIDERKFGEYSAALSLEEQYAVCPYPEPPVVVED